LENGIVIRVRVARRTDTVGIAMTGRELRVLRVIEGRSGPCGGVVTILASRREELWLRGVARIGRLVVVRLVASDASGGQRGVVVVHVAIAAHTRRHHM